MRPGQDRCQPVDVHCVPRYQHNRLLVDHKQVRANKNSLGHFTNPLLALIERVIRADRNKNLPVS